MKLNKIKILTLGIALSFGAAQASWLDTVKTGAKIVGVTSAVAATTYFVGKLSGSLLKNRAESRFADELTIAQNNGSFSDLEKSINANHVQRNKYNSYRNYPLVEEKADLDWYMAGLRILRFWHPAESRMSMQNLMSQLKQIRTTIISDSKFITQRQNFENKK